VASDDLAPINTPYFPPGINSLLFIFNHVFTTCKTSLRLAGPTATVAAITQGCWFKDAHKTCRSSESQNQVMIFKVDLPVAKPTHLKKFVAPNERHSRADETVAIARG
jgi:hypothetical protein